MPASPSCLSSLATTPVPRHTANQSALGNVSVSYTRFILLLLVGLFYCMAALEVDPGDVGDSFGDVFDTYLHSQSAKPSDHIRIANNDALVETSSFTPISSNTVYVWIQKPILPVSPLLTRRRWHLLCSVWQI
ncbi:hypothetical protein [Spirosoma oryzicola]|uniref:hypothetical protein n=1 Tax=Spirosoma oryzicola TaxID=2898794 RepID=UPI001E5A2DB2|nr:hypothetical protein [Spirosoma oryzicola]UHG94413.1 hypothetical protein LQ777_27205 [Spirosoma oryzicola]